MGKKRKRPSNISTKTTTTSDKWVEKLAKRFQNKKRKLDKSQRQQKRRADEKDRKSGEKVQWSFDHVVSRRKLPSGVSEEEESTSVFRRNQECRKNVVRKLVELCDAGVSWQDELPFRSGAELEDLECDPKFSLESFPELDEKTYQAVNSIYEREIRRRVARREQEARDNPQDSDEDEDQDDDPEDRPKSPGCEYDFQFVHAEIGVKQPRFKAQAHKATFQNMGLSKKKLQKIMGSAQGVESEMNKFYEMHSNVSRIEKNMVKEAKKRMREKRK